MAASAAAPLSSEIFCVEDFPVLDDLIDIPAEDYAFHFSDSSAIINPQHVSPWDGCFADIVLWPLDVSNPESGLNSGEDDATCQNSSSCRKTRSKRTKRRACELVPHSWGHSHGDTTTTNNDNDEEDEEFELDETSSAYDTSSTPSLSSTSPSSPKEVHHFPTLSDEAHRFQSSSDDEDTTTTNRVKVMRLSKKPKQSKKQKQEHRVCSHCGSQSTPQWREGPLGPKTLCNACGVRYKSGRLLPEYRPAASPTFNAGIHSNSHRRVLEMHMLNSNSTEHAHAPSKATPHQSLVF